MRVLFLHQFDLNYGGGSGVVLRAVAGALGKTGHEVAVVSARVPDRYGVTKYALPFDFTLTFGPEKRPNERTFAELSTVELQEMAKQAADSVEAAAFRSCPPDLILVNHISLMALVAWRLARRFGIEYRIISHGSDSLLLKEDRRLRDLFACPAKAAERIFAISGYVANEVKAALGVRDVEILGGAVDDKVFHLPAVQPDVDGAIAFVGRLVTEKGLWTLLEAHEKVGNKSSLRLVGEGPLHESIETYIETAPHGDRVNLLGHMPQTQIREVLINSALLAVPSTWQEPLGLVALEAIACGVPVVASAVGGLPEIVENGVNGYLVPPGDADALASAMDRVLADKELRAKLRRKVSRNPVPCYDQLAAAVIQ